MAAALASTVDARGTGTPLAAPAPARPAAVRVFDEEPDLLAGIDDRAADLLRRRVVAPLLRVEPGPWSPPSGTRMSGSFGLLVIEGLLLRTVLLDGRRCPEVVGAGDLVRPWDDIDACVPHATAWTAIEPAAFAVLDDRFAAIVCRWPSIVVALLSRTMSRSRSLALHHAIANVRHADQRVHMLLWHLADRWGRVTPDGVHVPLRLTHEVVAELACLRRPTASSAIKRLERRGELERRPGGTWLLTGSPPTAPPAHAGSRSASAQRDP
jgi:CRP/FNR family cyclic AMP-dependent transcriptional regulator